MKIARAALLVLALVGAFAFASTAQAQLPPVIIGGGNDSTQPGDGTTSQTLTGPGPALLAGATYADYSFSPSLLLARLHSWFAPVTLQTPTSGMLSARSVRFASAGRPNARVSRVTWW